MLTIFVILLTVLLVFVCLLMCLVVLMQRPKQEGLGAAFGGALTDKVLGSGTTDFLQKSTVYLGVMFFIFSLVIATLTARIQNVDRQAQVPEVETPAPAADEGMAGELPGVGAGDPLVPEPPIENIPTVPDADTPDDPAAQEPAEGVEPTAPDVEPPAPEGEAQPVEGADAPAEETPDGEAQPENGEVPVPSEDENAPAPAEPEPPGDNS